MPEERREQEIGEQRLAYAVTAPPEMWPDQHNGKAYSEEPISEAGKWVSEAEYWESYYEHPDFSYEWNNGILEEKPVSDFATVSIYYWFLTLLRAYLEAHPVAKVLMLEFGVRLALPHKTTIRKPDFFVVRNDNTTPIRNADRSYRGVCDLAVEALSDLTRKDKERDKVVKFGEYAGIGIREYYILHTDEGNQGFYRLNEFGAYEALQPVAGVVESAVLPGFRFRLDDLERQPALEDLAEDPVYQGFVLLKLQALRTQAAQERRRAERERRRAEVEQQRAEREQQRAEQAEAALAHERKRREELLARLRLLGIEDDSL